MKTPERREIHQAAAFHAFTTLALYTLAATLYSRNLDIAATIAGIAAVYHTFATAGILMLEDDEIPRKNEPFQFLEHTREEFFVIGVLIAGTAAFVALALTAPWPIVAALSAAWATLFAFAAIAASTIYEDD